MRTLSQLLLSVLLLFLPVSIAGAQSAPCAYTHRPTLVTTTNATLRGMAVANGKPVSVLTIYTSTEPSLKCSPPTSPVRPKATGRVHLPIACNPARPPDRSDESRAPLPHRHRKCCHASSPERGQRIGTYVPSSFNSQLSTINYPVAGPPRPAPQLTPSSSPHQRPSIHFRSNRACLRYSSATRASSFGVANVGHVRTNTLLLHDQPLVSWS